MAPQSGTLAALASLSRSAYQYPGHRDPQTALRQRMCESAATRLRCGYRKIRVLLLREGYRASKNRLYRLYREEGLSLRYRPNRKRRAQMSRPARAKSTAANQVWSLDFVADQLSSSRGRPRTDIWCLYRSRWSIGYRLRGAAKSTGRRRFGWQARGRWPSRQSRLARSRRWSPCNGPNC
ncbi:HTH-like domain protein [Burkholderia pseudomallei MSHR5492]|nr:putative transposase [Burkholderia pseudomallei Pasteur 52237]KGD57290.1 HTH-like domain protein [Burkholderia pseudomallei]KGS26285.1 HTH-like domain protein [Burkholderia pseudomallei MSHR5569]KGS41745.1 HTH-like domain protein [Burkholderia pseudomallei MSHR5492]